MTVVNIRTGRLLAAAVVVGGLLQTSPLLAGTTLARHASALAQPTQAAMPGKPSSDQPKTAAQAQQPQPQQPAAPAAPAPATPRPTTPAPSATPPPGVLPAGVTPPPADYVIGPDDVLQVVFWREKELSSEVTVRPDGKVSLALLNDIQASGLTPDQLRKNVMDAAARFVTDPSVTIVVKTINSRKVYVTGQVNKPGTFALTDAMTVLQMLALAGGLQEYADAQNILVMRMEQGQTKSFKFNYKDVRKGKNLQQNILLKPGDTIVIP